MTAESVLQNAMTLIAKASSESRIDEITRITRIAERVREIQRVHEKLDAELQSLATELSGSAPVAAKTVLSGPTNTALMNFRGPLAIEIDWSSIGLPLPKQLICERKASDTLRVLMENILAQFGDETLEKLASLRVNRAPPLSRCPQEDFLNRKRGITYQNQRIGDSAWYVLTHSSTNEKIEFVGQLARALRFPPGALTAREIDMRQTIVAF